MRGVLVLAVLVLFYGALGTAAEGGCAVPPGVGSRR